MSNKQSDWLVVPSWNGLDELKHSIPSLEKLDDKPQIVVVDNSSVDGSVDYLTKHHPTVKIVKLSRNHGFAGGVNAGIRKAIEHDAEFVALFNNDATADPAWYKNLRAVISADDKLGIVTGKLLTTDGKQLDSTGDYYTSWGLPYPRGRGESDINKYDQDTDILSASGGASLYRVKMLQQIGLFDEDFFAYYEDVDISWRAHLAGWKVRFVPTALAYHGIGTTSSKIKGFTTYQTLKNLPLLALKNLPARPYARLWPRFFLAHSLFILRALSRGQFGPAVKGSVMPFILLPKKLGERRRIQKHRVISSAEVEALIVHDLPPNAHALRTLRRILSLGRIK